MKPLTHGNSCAQRAAETPCCWDTQAPGSETRVLISSSVTGRTQDYANAFLILVWQCWLVLLVSHSGRP